MDSITTEPGAANRNVYFYGTLSPGSKPVVIAGFYTYGDTRWSSIEEWSNPLWRAHPTAVWDELRFFHYEPSANQVGAMLAVDAAFVKPGAYIIRDESAAEVALVVSIYRGRMLDAPTLPNAEHSDRQYIAHSRLRDDNTCLITGIHPATPTRLKATHIFPPSFVYEWNAKGYAHLIEEDAPASSIGATKINSLQNIITLRSDLRGAWDAYDLGVDVHDNYKVIAFNPGNDDLHGLRLKLDHIRDPKLRPLDVLLEDHFAQCVFKNMCGAGDEASSDE